MADLFANLRYKKFGDFDSKKLADAITKGYETKLRGDKVVKKVSFAPSSLGWKSGRCPRRWVLAFRGESIGTDTFTATSLAVMDQGQGAHSRIQEALQESGIMIEEEKEITHDDPPIRGFVDAIVEIDGIELPVEIKTTRDEAFAWRQTAMKPTQYHYYQLLTYMRILDYKVGAFVYENKNDNTLLVIPIEMDSVNTEVIDAALDWMRKVYKVYEDGDLPARPWKQTSPNCHDCVFFKTCWDDVPEGNVKIKPMVVHKW